MNKLLNVLGLSLILSCTNTPQEVKFNQDDYTPMTGKEVYETYCVACHGADGKMGFSGAKDLSESKISVSDRVKIITHGRGVMNPFKDVISPEEIERVAHYIDTLRVN